jgi:hypothetical protein
MRAQAIWRAITADEADFLNSLIVLLEQNRVRYCVIGGQAINAYADPVVSLDLDLVIAPERLKDVEALLQHHFSLTKFPRSLNLTLPGSDLRVQIQTDPRYFAFLERASIKNILGVGLPVASVDDLLQGKVWAVLDTERRPSKRQKDLADIARLLEGFPHLRFQVPTKILDLLL